MLYTRQDLCTVVGLAFEYLIQLEKEAKSIEQKEALLANLSCFNKTISGLRISFEELPVAIHAKAARFIDGAARKDGKGIKIPDAGPTDA